MKPCCCYPDQCTVLSLNDEHYCAKQRNMDQEDGEYLEPLLENEAMPDADADKDGPKWPDDFQGFGIVVKF